MSSDDADASRPPIAGLKVDKKGSTRTLFFLNQVDAEILRQFCYDNSFDDARDALRALVLNAAEQGKERWAAATVDRRKNTTAFRALMMGRMVKKLDELKQEIHDELTLLNYDLEEGYPNAD